MKRVVTVRVGADGMLTLTVPIAKADANKPVRVTVETLEGPTGAAPPADQEAWMRFIERTAEHHRPDV